MRPAKISLSMSALCALVMLVGCSSSESPLAKKSARTRALVANPAAPADAGPAPDPECVEDDECVLTLYSRPVEDFGDCYCPALCTRGDALPADVAAEYAAQFAAICGRARCDGGVCYTCPMGMCIRPTHTESAACVAGVCTKVLTPIEP